MEIIVVQGMTCLGKSTLCKQLEKDLINCKYFSIDEYKESMWDKFGFDTIEQREHLVKRARELFYSDLGEAIRKKIQDYILIDYVFRDDYWSELIEHIDFWGIPCKTVYLKPDNLLLHKRLWEARSRDFSVRHAGHGATSYHEGVGQDYTNNYEAKIFMELPVIDPTMEVQVSFNPYRRDKSYEDILKFINTTSI